MPFSNHLRPSEDAGPARLKRRAQALACAVLLLVLSVPDLRAQVIPVGDLREEQFRLQQLLNPGLTHPFTSRTLHWSAYERYMEEAGDEGNWWNRLLPYREYHNPGGLPGLTVGVYEPHMRYTYNSKVPYGENNAAAWLGRGSNLEWQGGFYARYGNLTFNFRPHVAWQENRAFIVPRYVTSEVDGETTYGGLIGNIIDRPYRFGPDPFWTFDWGHTSLRAEAGNTAFGFSTEPMWWGPAVRYPLVMSNNAPGFPRFYAGTRGPVGVPYIGTVEFTWTVGWPRNSEWFGYQDPYHRQQRLFNGFNLTWSPSFVPNLYLGMTRAYHQFTSEGSPFSNIFAIFDPTQRDVLITLDGDGQHDGMRNLMGSFYVRWLFPEAMAEVYGEYFREGNNYNSRDFMMEPQQNRAWTVGFQKMVEPGFLDLLKVNVEYNDLLAPVIHQVRSHAYYYSHFRMRAGHTNEGKVLGAAIGPGSQSLFVGLDAYHDDFQVGIYGQRWVDNDQFHYTQTHTNFRNNPYFAHRVNMNYGMDLLWNSGDFVLSMKLQRTHMFNYGRFTYGTYLGYGDRRFRNDEYNTQVQFSIRYLLQ